MLSVMLSMTRRMSRTLLLTVVAGSVALAMPASEQTQRSIGAAGAPTAVIDFAAVDAKGQPISDLTPGDVTVTIAGKPRAVKDLQFVKSGGTAAAGDALPAPFASNVSTGGGGRASFVVIDSETLTTGQEQRVRDGIASYINTLGPQDAASIATVPHGGVKVGLTTDLA
jgi:hypothetical protein